MNFDERRAMVEEISTKVVDRIRVWFQDNDPSSLMIYRNQISGIHEPTEGWHALATSVVEDLAGRGIIDLNQPKCRCPLDTLMVSGCKCGEIQRSK